MLCDFFMFVYFSQVMQVEGIVLVVLYYCVLWLYMMGLLYWQFNDVWLGVLWFSIDYVGCWKVLYFQVCCFFVDQVVVVLCDDDGIIWISLFNDCCDVLVGQWWLWVMDFDGCVYICQQYVVMVLLGVVLEVVWLDDVVLFGQVDCYCIVVVVELLDGGGKLVLQGVVYFDVVKVLVLFWLQIYIDLQCVGDGYCLCLCSDWLVCVVWIGFDGLDVVLQDNVLMLLFGEIVQVNFIVDVDLVMLCCVLWVQLLVDVLVLSVDVSVVC